MSEQEDRYKQYEEMIKEAELNAGQARLGSNQREMAMEQQQTNLAESQLDLSKELLNFYYQLHGFTLKPNDNGEMVWTKDQEGDLSFLSELGRNYLFWMVQGYLNKNTLLSNYDDDTIRKKMEDIATVISDTLFMKYDKYFNMPTLDHCKKEIEARIKRKVDVRQFALELVGNKGDVVKIRAEILKEMEGRIERELEISKSNLIKDGLKMYESIVRLVQDTIHSAYNRAYKGQERKTLREHITISETKGGYHPQPPSNGGVMGIFKK